MSRSFFFLVCAAMFPLLYILPQYGSTLMMTSLFIVGSTTIYTLIHLTAYSCVVWAAARWGIYIGKDWLWSLPSVAMLFEFLPILNTVELVPSMLLGLMFCIAMLSPNLLVEQEESTKRSDKRLSNAQARKQQEKAFRNSRAPGVGLNMEQAIADVQASEAQKQARLKALEAARSVAYRNQSH